MNQDVFKDIPQQMIPFAKGVILFIFLVFDVIYFLYIKNLFDLMKLVSPDNRRIAPGKIWLLLISFISMIVIIPLFTAKEMPKLYDNILDGIEIGAQIFLLIFTFYMVNKISESLATELKSRRVSNDPKPTLNAGMFMCICNTASLLAGVRYVAVIGILGSLLGLIAWIMYWVKTYEYRKKLETLPPATSSLNDLGIF